MTQTGRHIADLIESHGQGRLYTHAYASVGNLGEPAPRLEYGHGAGVRDHLFDLASLTKALVTAPLIAEALQGDREGRVDVDTLSGSRGLGELPAGLRRLPGRDVLQHQSVLPAWHNFWVGAFDSRGRLDWTSIPQRLNRGLARAFARARSSEAAEYSDVGYILLGMALERRFGVSLAQAFRSWTSDRLGFRRHDLVYAAELAAAERERCIPTAYCPLRLRHLRGEVHDENAAALGGVTGHAGLFGTGAAVEEFLRRLMGSAVGDRLRTAANGTVVPYPLGWWRATESSLGTDACQLWIGHPGFTGGVFWVHSETLDYLILLTNRVVSGRRSALIGPLRREFFALARSVWGAR